VDQHFRTEIGGDHFALRDLILDFQRQIAGAAGDVEQPPGFPFANAGGDDFPPQNVHAAAQHMVGEHIAIGDAGEGIMDVNGVGHARRVNRIRNRTSAN